MQRNALYSHAAKFASALMVLFILSGCAGSPFPEDETTGTAPSPSPAVTAQTVTPPIPSVQPTTDKNKVALLVPMTGRGSEAGQAMLNAAQLAMFDLGADAFELIPADTGKSPAFAARDALGKGAKLVLGPLFAADAKDVAPIAAQSNVNVISFSTDSSVAGPNTFVLGFLPQSQVTSVLDYAHARGLTRIALIAPNDAFGNAVVNNFDMDLHQRRLANASVIRYEGSEPTAEQISQLVSSNPTAVLIAANISQSAAISQKLPSNIQRLGTGLWEQADGSRYPSLKGAWYAASSPKLRQKFESKYQETYGANPPRLASLAYDAAALAVVLSRQGNNFDRNALVNPNGFSGIDGIFRFLPDGRNERGLSILQIGETTPVVIQDAPQSFR